MRNIKRIIFICMVAVMLFCLILPVYAAEEALTLTLTCMHDDKPVAGVSMKLYQVASLNEDLQIQAADRFSLFREEIESDSVHWEELASNLAEYIGEHPESVLDETVLDDTGTGQFPNTCLTLHPGIYLVLCPDYRLDGFIYRFSPVIVSLHNFSGSDQQTGKITATMKFCAEPDIPLDIVVTKRWEDAGREQSRPSEIVVDLLQNGVPVKDAECILGVQNNWTGGWTGLDPLYQWSIQERPVSGYAEPVITWNTEDDGCRLVTILNSLEVEESTPPKLPQTGQLCWPIPWLALIGMFLFALGWWLRFGGRKDKP